MITLGLDPHPSSHTVAALDETGACLEALTVPNTPEGLGQLHCFASAYEQRQWAIEGAGNRFIAPFVGQLLAQGEKVINIALSLTSQYRARRGRKKNDVVDAENAARALLANPHLPILRVFAQQRELQELTRTQRRLSGQLKSNRRALGELNKASAVETVLRQVIDALAAQLKVLEQRIQALVRKLLPQLLELCGVGPVVAGVLLSEVCTTVRFATEDHFASYCGAAPVERGSGQNRRMQVNSGGNRKLNWALHIVALVRLRVDGGRSRALLDKLKRRGKSQRAALRILKTYIARELFRVMRQAEEVKNLAPRP